jgi:hypothetical protein
VYEGIYRKTGGQAIVQKVGVYPDIVFTMEAGVLDEHTSTGPKVEVPVSGEKAAV